MGETYLRLDRIHFSNSSDPNDFVARLVCLIIDRVYLNRHESVLNARFTVNQEIVKNYTLDNEYLPESEIILSYMQDYYEFCNELQRQSPGSKFTPVTITTSEDGSD